MNVLIFRPEHVSGMNLQHKQQHWVSRMTPRYLAGLNVVGPAFSVEIEGRIIACAGIADQGFEVGLLWALLAADAGKHMLRLHRCVLRLMDMVQLQRLEATAPKSFAESCRWLEMLGFKVEGVKRRYVDGEDHVMYARLK